MRVGNELGFTILLLTLTSQISKCDILTFIKLEGLVVGAVRVNSRRWECSDGGWEEEGFQQSFLRHE